MWGLRETVIHSGTGHLQVALNDRFFIEGASDPFPYLITNSEQVTRKIRSIPEVKDVLPSIQFMAVLQGSEKSENSIVIAMPTDKASEHLGFRSIIEGRDLNTEDRSAIIVGKGLADKLGAQVGSYLHVMSAMAGGGVNLLDLEIVGIAQSGIATLDAAVAYMPMTTAQELLLVNDVPQLTVFLEKTDDTAIVQEKLRKKILPAFGGLSVRNWEELSDYYRQANGSYQVILGVARLIVILVALFAIANTVSMAVFERMREIGTIRSLGTTRSRVIVTFLVEGLLLGIGGSIAGIVIGLFSCQLANWAGGINLPAQPGMTEALTILFTPDLKSVASNPLYSIPAAVIASLVPAYRTVHLKITDALRAR